MDIHLFRGMLFSLFLLTSEHSSQLTVPARSEHDQTGGKPVRERGSLPNGDCRTLSFEMLDTNSDGVIDREVPRPPLKIHMSTVHLLPPSIHI